MRSGVFWGFMGFLLIFEKLIILGKSLYLGKWINLEKVDILGKSGYFEKWIFYGFWDSSVTEPSITTGSKMNNLEKNIWKLHKPLGIKNSWILSHTESHGSKRIQTESRRILSVSQNHLIISTTISFKVFLPPDRLGNFFKFRKMFGKIFPF